MNLSILYFMGSQLKISIFLYISVPFILANSAENDVMLPNVAFHLGPMKCHNSGCLHCLPKFTYIQNEKG